MIIAKRPKKYLYLAQPDRPCKIFSISPTEKILFLPKLAKNKIQGNILQTLFIKDLFQETQQISFIIFVISIRILFLHQERGLFCMQAEVICLTSVEILEKGLNKDF